MSKTITISDTEVHINGNGNKIMMMIHGWPDTHEIWKKQVDFFQKEYTCVTFTLPGFSKGDNRTFTLENIVNRIHEITEAVSPDSKIIIMLHDWGCVFGYEYAMRYPDKIEKLIGIDVGNASSKEFVDTLSLQSKLLVFSYQFTLALGWLTKSDFIHKTMAKGLKARSNFNNIHAGMGLPYAMRWLGVNGGMKKLKPVQPSFPFFYTYGTKKPFLFQTENWLNDLEKNPANKVKAFNCSHWVMVDKADEFNEAVGKWLKQ